MTRRSKLIVGLGNPGPKYTTTRHNAGFLVLESLCAQNKTVWRNAASHYGMLAKIVIQDCDCSLLKPVTFMNESGLSVKKLVEKQTIAPEDILIVCDDLSLPFGKLRLRPSGSAGGHNGLKSIIEALGTDQFARLRFGIGEPRAGADTVDYVLSNFTPVETKALPDLINHALDCVTCWVTEGATGSMNKFN